MNDFRAEALRLYNSTRSNDSNRGVIAALLHVAELLTEHRCSEQPAFAAPEDEHEVWRSAALTHLRQSARSRTAKKISNWLVGQGYEVAPEDVSRAMWELTVQDRVVPSEGHDGQAFSAKTEK